MRNKIEQLLLSVLLGLSILLGLSFWLNTIFNFNIFLIAHWDDFAKLQASHTPISIGFYLSFIVAILIFVFGLYFIYRPLATTQTKKVETPTTVVQKQNTPEEKKIIKPEEKQKTAGTSILTSRPPRLNLPTNMAQIAEQHHTTQQVQQKNNIPSSENPYNPIISEIFSNNGYTVKPNPTISGFVPNLFAIGNNEVVWVGGVDCDIEKMTTALEKLDSVFKDTLEDIPININSFILDTMNKYEKSNNILIFKSTDELKDFITEHPADVTSDADKENFYSYSEYIDTIIQYIKNI